MTATSRPEVLVQPARADNYQFVIQPGGQALAVDPADADAVRAGIAAAGGRLVAILLTHHHPDHVAGVPGLRADWTGPILGPADERMPMVTRVVAGGESFTLAGLDFHVLATPGHTSTQIAYHLPAAGLLFAADLIFPGGCGRRAPEMSPAVYFASLQQLRALPPDTLVYAGHEYAEENLRFAREVAPDDPAVRARAEAVARRRAEGRPTIPFRLGDELASNLFLRAPDAAAFDVLRRRKDVFA